MIDFSMQCEMGSRGLRLCGFTGLKNDLKGQFISNSAAPNFAKRLPAGVAGAFSGPVDIVARLHRLFDQVRKRLEAKLVDAGYSGPVGIDAFVYRDIDGQCHLKPIVEINPRYTMGRVTLELMKRVAPGSAGTFRIVTNAQLKKAGFETFPDFAASEASRLPLRLTGEPVSKINEGFLCLSDPETAQTCLATFKVNR
jgi:hypothetical protein